MYGMCCVQNLGGIKYHFLTHQDDVAGHDKWHEALNTHRIIHSTETNSSQRTEYVACLCHCVLWKMQHHELFECNHVIATQLVLPNWSDWFSFHLVLNATSLSHWHLLDIFAHMHQTTAHICPATLNIETAFTSSIEAVC